MDTFKRSIDPLMKYGKLGALLAQFPPSFKNDSFGQQIISAVIKTFGQYQLAVKLRHRNWSDDENTSSLLRAHNAAWVQIDEPKFSSSIATELPVTSDIAYFRFHGRNAEMWWKGDGESRYRYLYSPEEIKELSERVRSSASSTKYTFVFFNNHWQAYAPRNANGLKRELSLPIKEPTTQTILTEENTD